MTLKYSDNHDMHTDSALTAHMNKNIGESRTDCIRIRGRDFFVKRDDLIDPLLSGNKFRKLYKLIQTPPEQYHAIISYGGTQSNAMLSIAALCHQKGWQFHYTSKHVPAHIKASPAGNLKAALKLGMQLHEVTPDNYENAALALRSQSDGSTLLIPQGGASPMARDGIHQLAQEIKYWQQSNSIENLYVVTPSGTGTTAFYLATALTDSVVLTTPAVGDKAYLISQMSNLGMLPVNLHILKNCKKYHFALPCPEFLAIYQELNHAGVEFDLIYAPGMWHTLFQHTDQIEGTILYVHSGGLAGNATMLDRYTHKHLL